MIGATWAWVVGGLAAFLVLGLLAALALGLAGAPGDFVRRLGQTLRRPRVDRGAQLPDEVPDRTAEEVSAEVDEREGD